MYTSAVSCYVTYSPQSQLLCDQYTLVCCYVMYTSVFSCYVTYSPQSLLLHDSVAHQSQLLHDLYTLVCCCMTYMYMYIYVSLSCYVNYTSISVAMWLIHVSLRCYVTNTSWACGPRCTLYKAISTSLYNLYLLPNLICQYNYSYPSGGWTTSPVGLSNPLSTITFLKLPLPLATSIRGPSKSIKYIFPVIQSILKSSGIPRPLIKVLISLPFKSEAMIELVDLSLQNISPSLCEWRW